MSNLSHMSDYRFEIKDVPEQPAMFIKATCRHDKIGDVAQRTLPAVFNHIVSSGGQPGGPPFIRYTDWREDDCDLEAGVPTTEPMDSAGEIESGSLGGGAAACTVHEGHYQGLPGAHQAAMTWIESNGHEVGGAPWENYITDPGELPNPDDWRTEVCWPVR